jgi:hypothetical protein
MPELTAVAAVGYQLASADCDQRLWACWPKNCATENSHDRDHSAVVAGWPRYCTPGLVVESESGHYILLGTALQTVLTNRLKPVRLPATLTERLVRRACGTAIDQRPALGR